MRILTGLTAALILLNTSLSLSAQVQDKPFLEEERRKEMDARLEEENEDLQQPFLWDAGGWLNLQVIDLDDEPDREQRTMRYADLRLWGEARLHEHYTAYLRVRTDYVDFNSRDQFEGSDDNQYQSPRVDQAWVQAAAEFPGGGADVRAGRQFLTMGSGLLYNSVAYGIMGRYQRGRLGARGFASFTPPHDDDIDTSLPNADDSRRGFAGMEVALKLSGPTRIAVMALAERDFNDEDPDVPGQNWDYHANYFGISLSGKLLRNFDFAAEAVLQRGRSIAAGTTTYQSIKAHAVTFRIDHTTDLPFLLSLHGAYLYGSGDSDRKSVTDAAAGNAVGTNDEGFLPFGFVQTGYSLYPLVSNIHISRVGASVWPLEPFLDEYKYLEVGFMGYRYRKDAAKAPISDPRSFLPSKDVGTELDLFLRWRVLSDVSITVNYGRFFPGKAYVEDDARDFFSSGLTYSF